MQSKININAMNTVKIPEAYETVMAFAGVKHNRSLVLMSNAINNRSTRHISTVLCVNVSSLR